MSLVLRIESPSLISSNPALSGTASLKGSGLTASEIDTNFITLQNTKENYLGLPTGEGFRLSSDTVGNRVWVPSNKGYTKFSSTTITNADIGKLAGMNSSGYVETYSKTPFSGLGAFTMFDPGNNWTGATFTIYNAITSGIVTITNSEVPATVNNVVDKQNIVSYINLNYPSVFKAEYRPDIKTNSTGGTIAISHVVKSHIPNATSYVSGTSGFCGMDVTWNNQNSDGIKLTVVKNNPSGITYFTYGSGGFDAPIMQPVGKIVGASGNTIYIESNEVDSYITNNNVTFYRPETFDSLYDYTSKYNFQTSFSGTTGGMNVLIFGSTSGNVESAVVEYSKPVGNATAFTLSIIGKPLGVPITTATTGNAVLVKRT